MKKALVSTVFALSLLLGLAPNAAFAADRGSMKNFVPEKTYDGRFNDVPENVWYYGNVCALYELGLTDGQSPHSFGATSDVTIAEALSFASRIHSTYHLGQPNQGAQEYAHEDDPWYMPYVRYLQAEEIVDERFAGQYTQPATRAQAAYILRRVLPEKEFEDINAGVVNTGYSLRKFIRDVPADARYAEDVLNLYRWGIAGGSDATGTFHPDNGITRCELAAMLTRIVEPTLRVTLDWDISSAYSAKGTTYADLIWEPGAYSKRHDFSDQDAILNNVRYTLKNGENGLSMKYRAGEVNSMSSELLMYYYMEALQLYLEQGYNEVICQYDSLGNVTLGFSDSTGGRRNATLQRAIEIHDELWADGSIRPTMTQKEKAKVYLEYLCENCEYDHTSRDLSHSAFGAFFDHQAVCQGYTAAYNLLLKLEGIDCATAQFPDHIWTTATLDGELYHIDATWADQSYGVEYKYFCMTPEYAENRDPYGFDVFLSPL